MEKIGDMLLWTMNSWDLKVDDKGVYFPISRHDGSIMHIPMAFGMKPVGNPDMKFVCLGGQYAGYLGFQTGWIPQPAVPGDV